jgi:hypothetical protein
MVAPLIYINVANELYMVEYGGHRASRFLNGSRNGTVVAGTGLSGVTVTGANSDLGRANGLGFDKDHYMCPSDASNSREVR